MPGVPSGRGCDACRKSKKKCDQEKPSCSRCTRLKVPCVGSGQQRYKFMTVIPKAKPVSPSRADPNSLTLVPASRVDIITSNFVSKISIDDIRYDLTCFGSFLQHVPRRLGSNLALDTSVDAFATASKIFFTGEQSVEALAKYTVAIKALRGCLNDPTASQTPETMCAVYLVMIVQTWISRQNDQFMTHAEGLACMLKASADREWTTPKSDFEIELLVTMCIPVIVESISNPRVNIHPWLWKLFDKLAPSQPTGPSRPEYSESDMKNPVVYPSLKLRSLAKLPKFILEPELHRLDILSTYYALCIDSNKLRGIKEMLCSEKPMNPTQFLPIRDRRRYQVLYTLAVGLAITLNRILQAFDPSDVSLQKEGELFMQQIIIEAKDALKYRPLGASHVMISVTLACAVTRNPEQHAYLLGLLEELGSASPMADWAKNAGWWKSKFEEMSERLRPKPELLMEDSAIDVELSQDRCPVQ